jgi:hypothetical protein
MRAVLPATLPGEKYRYWNAEGWWGDQGPTPQCVAYAWNHWLEDGPTTQPETPHGTGPVVNCTELYYEAQKVDEWAGEAYDGTSVRAGAKILKAKGYISSYRWADPSNPVDDIVRALLTMGPVVVGTDWYSEMFTPDEFGFLSVDGRVVGGHAYLLNGVNTDREIVRVKNSWGHGWGRNGHAILAFKDLGRLLQNFGEACLAFEVRQNG